MRSAKSDVKVRTDIEKYEIDPDTGEVFVNEADESRILLKDYEGNIVMPAFPFSIGIDVHKMFIQVSVMVRVDQCVKEYHFQADTDYDSLCHAKKTAIQIIETFSSPHIDVDPDQLRYACESTGNWHHPLLRAWGGRPIVVNPSIAKAGRRKSDRIDSFILAQNSLMGTWPESFVVPPDINILRMYYQQRRHCERRATQISNSISSELLRFGVNIARDGSVTRNKEIRTHVMDQLSEHPNMEPGKSHDFLPDEVKEALKENYQKWDDYKATSEEYLKKIRNKIESMKWKCGGNEIGGAEMIQLLMSVPAIGETTAMIWLTFIVDAARFSSFEKCVAFCGFDPSAATSAGKVVSGKKRKGNKDLHEALKRCAGILIKNQNEPFGRWAANIYGKTGKWKKATNALGRKLVIALYYVHKTGNEFDYSMYRTEEPQVIDIRLEELIVIEPRFKRYVRKLIPLGIRMTQEMVHAYHLCKFKRVKGLGKGFYNLVSAFIENQETYSKKYFNIYGMGDTLDEEERADFNE